jgi:prepilin-type N-terminal cleavage/methylation domain-containing protein
MKVRKELFEKKSGFTIVELLTVMSVIAILIGLLVPALNLVKDFAKEVQQQSQFHSIEVGLGLYKKEFGSYPPSNDNSIAPIHLGDGTLYCGANKLAEALVGMDFMGFHPNADFRADGSNDVINIDGSMTDDALLYIIPPGSGNVPWPTQDENIQARKGPFVELENANAFQMGDIYNAFGGFRGDSLVLCDVFVSRRTSGMKTGMPILYYRARTNYSQQNSSVAPNYIDDDIYYYPDNFNLIDLGTAQATSLAHPLADNGPGAVVPAPAAFSGDVASGDDWLDFENIILNRQVTAINRPYRAGSYILISAGKDGLYGTADDLQNFKKEIPF